MHIQIFSVSLHHSVLDLDASPSGVAVDEEDARLSLSILTRLTGIWKTAMLNLYVGNLPYSMNDQELNDLFSQIGDVQSARVMSDRETGRSRGFGFVEMADDDAGHEAIEKLNGQDCDGRALVVNEARPREERPRRSGGFGGGGGRGGYGGGGGGGGRSGGGRSGGW